ncbi:leucyl aminopeptidase [Mobilicoccus pelagius]|uniref:Probable cytosol aminopeptidase n=1 Tax=Mobilicoccus pelagius NBRC 104925 TaxID=1089455 RepID=H5UQ53_9MICO|nr:leucyl aminopeptidase [Mobilicoccus pelagius]GAB47858.1 putative cytosol aminopeptidase [Mobilicoccus pelagius NBRC 104925]
MKLAFATTAPESARADALVVFSAPASGMMAAPRLVGADTLPGAAISHLEESLRALKATGKADEVRTLTGVPKVAARVVVVTGLGSVPAGEEPTHEAVRRAAGAAARTLTGHGEAAVALPVATPEHTAAVAAGLVLGSYRFDAHRGAKAQAAAEAPLVSATLVAGKKSLAPGVSASDLSKAVEEAEIVARHQCFTRDLVNTAPNELYPQSFAELVEKAAGKGVKVEVMDEKKLAAGGFGGLIAVGQGSVRPPRLVTMTYSPRKAVASLAYVGKGITFDSGGLSLKPPASMMTMKSDMGGAAAVAAAVLAVAELELPVAVTGYLCLAENMPSGSATRPGDVITQRGGLTVEVLNTDAEGRLVLADGIALAAESRPDAIVDIATLTGAQIVALGKRTAAILANDDELQGALAQAAADAGESVWPLPIAEEVRSHLDSTVADMKNIGEAGTAGTLVAAAFLREFASPTDDDPARTQPWGHIDIAGPSFNEGGTWGYTGKGATGFGVPTLVEFARGYARSRD